MPVLPRKPGLARFALAASLAGLGCADAFIVAQPSQPVSMAPMADATLSVELGKVVLTRSVLNFGMNEDAALGVVLGVTNAGREPYTLNAGSLSCWLELSPDRPGETLSLTPAGGGEGDFPDAALDDLKLGTTTIPPGGTRHYWVMFRGYRYAGSDVPRKIIVSLPDARGRRVQIVIADPAHGDLRWQLPAQRAGIAYGFQNVSLFAPGFTATAMAGQFTLVSRVGPIFYDFGLTARTVVESKGRVPSETSAFTSTGLNAHVTAPFAGWGNWQDPRRLGVYAGGEGQILIEVRHENDPNMSPRAYPTVAVEGGLELAFGAQAPAASPFPISFSGPGLPRWMLRFGYTHWFVSNSNGGGDINSGGYVTSIRFAW